MKIKILSKEYFFDHAVIVVSNLDEAIVNFTSLGFQVKRGGKTGAVHNALIFFEDGTYIELTTPISVQVRRLFQFFYLMGILSLAERVSSTLMHRFYNWFGGPIGLRDWCIRCNDIEQTIANLQKNNVRTTKSKLFSRERPDGKFAKWRLAGPTNRKYPFLIEDVSPTEIRVPFKNACKHKNEVTGISAIVMRYDPGHEFIQNFKLDNAPENETHIMSNIAIRLTEEKSAPLLALELVSTGQLKGPFSTNLTSNALITII